MKAEAQWVFALPGQRTEEAFLPPTGRPNEEFIRLSEVALEKSGELGRGFPARSVTGPVGGPRGAGDLLVRRFVACEWGL